MLLIQLLLILSLINIQIITFLSSAYSKGNFPPLLVSFFFSLDFQFQYPSFHQIKQFYHSPTPILSVYLLFHLMAVGILALYNSRENSYIKGTLKPVSKMRRHCVHEERL